MKGPSEIDLTCGLIAFHMPSVFESVQKFYSYPEFLQLCESLVAQGATTGADQSELKINFTKLNLQRMHRWDKTFVVDEALGNRLTLARPQIWWLITEAWCGDSAQNLPGIAKMAAASGGAIELRIILRDENPEIMDRYLTNGGRSIPKLIAVDKNNGEEGFTWGPRPAAAQTLMMAWKQDPQDKSFDEFELELHTWYTRDKGHSLREEISPLISWS